MWSPTWETRLRHNGEKMIKQLIKSTLRALGLRLYWEAGLPFGIDLMLDIKRITGEEPNVKTIVDVGANIGQSVERFHLLFPGCKVVSCEPAPAAFDTLNRRFRGNPLVHCEQLALGACSGTIPFHVFGPLTEYNRVADSAGEGTIQVPIETLDNLAERLDLHTIDLLKIDTEGHELEVLNPSFA